MRGGVESEEVVTEDWAIIGYMNGFRRRTRIVRFAGGRSRRKLEWIAFRMNDTGDYRVSVRWVRMAGKS